jgi:hypothetical protein
MRKFIIASFAAASFAAVPAYAQAVDSAQPASPNDPAAQTADPSAATGMPGSADTATGSSHAKRHVRHQARKAPGSSGDTGAPATATTNSNSVETPAASGPAPDSGSAPR